MMIFPDLISPNAVCLACGAVMLAAGLLVLRVSGRCELSRRTVVAGALALLGILGVASGWSGRSSIALAVLLLAACAAAARVLWLDPFEGAGTWRRMTGWPPLGPDHTPEDHA